MTKMDTLETSRQFKMRYWTGRINECRNSGKTTKAWCRDNDVNTKTYYRWIKILREHAIEESPFLSEEPVPKLVEVRPNILSPDSRALPDRSAEGILPMSASVNIGNVRIEMNNNASEELIMRIIRVARHVQ